jgi:hypothetical protein
VASHALHPTLQSLRSFRSGERGRYKQKGTLLFAENWYIFYTMYSFEYDERKSQSNLKKHGIDFVEAQALWNDPYLVEIPARTTDEERFLVIGKIQEKHYSAVITPRGGNVRIISVRRSRIEEVAIYES